MSCLIQRVLWLLLVIDSMGGVQMHQIKKHQNNVAEQNLKGGEQKIPY